MLDFEQQANQAQALASLDEDWHLLGDAKMKLEEDLVIRRSRPTMISAKYRAREERRRLLKISAAKLNSIDDPEASLCRSVLINNAVRRLQRENRDEKTRNYGFSSHNYYDDSSKENNSSENLIDSMDTDNATKKRLSDELCENENIKRQRHDDLDLQDDVFSDFYMLPPTPRLLSHIDDIPEPQSDHSLNNYHDNRLDNHNTTNSTSSTSSPAVVASSSSSSSLSLSLSLSLTSSLAAVAVATSSTVSHSSSIFSTTNEIDTQLTIGTRSSDQMSLMDVTDVGCDSDRICDFSRFVDSTKSLEERLVELQALDEHFDLTKFERNNNQSCGRAFHDIQTFHSLVPGLET